MISKFTDLLKLATATACLTVVTGQAAHAGQLVNDWNYAIDSFNDGSEAGVFGSASDFEFYGLATKVTETSVFVAINSNLALGGYDYSGAADGHIGYGDLFFNFSGDNLATANGNLFGIRFAENNESGVSELGVYGNVTGKNIAETNSGFTDLKHHNNYTQEVTGAGASMGDLAANDSYFQYDADWSTPNSIASGTKLGNINMLTSSNLDTEGLFFSAFGATGSHTFGFSFDRSLLPTGDFIAHLFAECLNDGLALTGDLEFDQFEQADPTLAASVPEPSGVASVMVLGAIGVVSRRRSA